MKNGINKATILGYVGEDPLIRETKEKIKVANFSVATNEYWKDKSGNEVQSTEWHRVIAWDKRAELVNDFVKKGDPVFVEGRIRTSSWEDKEGVKRYSTEIICDNVLFLNTKKDE